MLKKIGMITLMLTLSGRALKIMNKAKLNHMLGLDSIQLYKLVETKEITK